MDFVAMDKLSTLEALQVVHDKYFNLMLEHYPLILREGTSAKFGPEELCYLAIEAHCYAIALGSKALDRLFHLGFDLLYPFDNPVDHFNWREKVKLEKIDHTTYASIAIRIDAELKRIRRVHSLNAFSEYEAVPTEIFLVSKQRYTLLPSPDISESVHVTSGDVPPPSLVKIDAMNICAPDTRAVTEIEKGAELGANFSNIITALRTFFGS